MTKNYWTDKQLSHNDLDERGKSLGLLSDDLRFFRRSLDLSQDEMASILKVARQTIIRVEKGDELDCTENMLCKYITLINALLQLNCMDKISTMICVEIKEKLSIRLQKSIDTSKLKEYIQRRE